VAVLQSRAPGGVDVDQEDASRARRAIDVPVAIVTTGAAIGSSALYWATHYNLTDDGYISLAYAKTLAFHGTWGMVPHHSANAATSPLNVLLMAAGIVLTRRPLLALGILFVVSYTIIGWSTARTARALDIPIIASPFAVAMLLLNPILLSSTGLESALYIALLAALLMCAVERREVAFGVVAGLALLTRLDTVLFVIPLLLFTPTLRRRSLRITAIAVAVALPWYLLRWLLAGSAIPDTFVIKTLQKAFGTVSFGNGMFRFMDGGNDIARWSFAPILFAGIATLGYFVVSAVLGDKIDPRFMCVAALAIGAVAYYAAYTALEVPAYHWYYNPVTGSATIVFALFVSAAARALSRLPIVSRWRLVPATFLIFVLPAFVVYRQERIEQRHGFVWRHAPIWYGNWAEPTYYRAAARDLRELLHDKTATGFGEIGALAFYCECGLIDQFSEESFAKPYIQTRIDEAGPLMRFLLDLNYANLDLKSPGIHIDYQLLYVPGFVAPAPLVWNTWSLPRGPGHLALVPN
jgi:hypothetical protein